MDQARRGGARGWALALCLACAGCDLIVDFDELDPQAPKKTSARVDWALQLGGSGPQRVMAVAVDANGNVIIGGQFRGVLEAGGAALSAPDHLMPFIASYDPSGAHRWSRAIETSLGAGVHSVAVDTYGNVHAAGYFGGDLTFEDQSFAGGGAFVLRFSADGELRWAWHLESADSVLVEVAATSNRVLIAGSHLDDLQLVRDGITEATLPSAAHRWSGFAARIEHYGDLLDARTFSNGSTHRFDHVAIAGGEEILVGGTLDGTIDFDGRVLEAAGANDVFLARLTFALEHRWSQRFGDDGSNCFPYCEVRVAAGADGTALFSAAVAGEVSFGGETFTPGFGADVLVGAFDATGESGAPRHRWSRAAGDAMEQRPYGLAVLSDGATVVSGGFSGSVDFGGGPVADVGPGEKDIFLATLEPDGSHRFTEVFVNTSQDLVDDDARVAARLAVGPHDDVVLAGTFRGTLVLGDRSLDAISWDGYIVKLLPSL